MKKKLVSLTTLILLVGITVLFAGCSMGSNKKTKATNKIVGVWKAQDVDGEFFLCFTADGKMYDSFKENGKLVRFEPVNYSINGNKLKMGNEDNEYIIKGDGLTIKTAKEETYTYKRVSSPAEAEIKAAPIYKP